MTTPEKDKVSEDICVSSVNTQSLKVPQSTSCTERHTVSLSHNLRNAAAPLKALSRWRQSRYRFPLSAVKGLSLFLHWRVVIVQRYMDNHRGRVQRNDATIQGLQHEARHAVETRSECLTLTFVFVIYIKKRPSANQQSFGKNTCCCTSGLKQTHTFIFQVMQSLHRKKIKQGSAVAKKYDY